MAAGEFVSVQSQADTEKADLAKERIELQLDPSGELVELTSIYISRGLDPELAQRVAERLSQHDALAAHARDELGLSEILRARPIQAAGASAASFLIGALLPLITIVFSPANRITEITTAAALLALVALGALSAQAGGSSRRRSALRMLFWGALAMGLTALVGHWFGAVV
jgi:VIT1/CCC1 family predicted Fe2+/Mn2+ transporter